MAQSKAAASYEAERQLMMTALTRGSLIVPLASKRDAEILRMRCYWARTQERRQNKSMDAGEISAFDSLVLKVAGEKLFIMIQADIKFAGKVILMATGEEIEL